MSESESQIKEIKRIYAGLQTLYNTYFPKSDPSLIHDLLRRLQRNPDAAPIYMLEVSTRRGVNPEAAKKYIFEKTWSLRYTRMERCLLQIRDSPWKC
jgi:hypothetical protein